MRLAIVIASNYQLSGQLAPIARSPEDADRFAGFLEEHDSAILIEEFAADRQLAEHIEAALEEHEGQIEQLLVYFSGYVIAVEGRDLSFILDGERLGAFGLPRLRRLIEKDAKNALVIADVAAVAPDHMTLDGVGQDFENALCDGGKANALFAIRSQAAAARDAGTSFTDLLMFCWDTATSGDADEEFWASDLYEAMAGEGAFADLEFAKFVKGSRDFGLLGVSEGQESAPELPPPPAPLPLPEDLPLPPESHLSSLGGTEGEAETTIVGSLLEQALEEADSEHTLVDDTLQSAEEGEVEATVVDRMPIPAPTPPPPGRKRDTDPAPAPPPPAEDRVAAEDQLPRFGDSDPVAAGEVSDAPAPAAASANAGPPPPLPPPMVPSSALPPPRVPSSVAASPARAPGASSSPLPPPPPPIGTTSAVPPPPPPIGATSSVPPPPPPVTTSSTPPPPPGPLPNPEATAAEPHEVPDEQPPLEPEPPPPTFEDHMQRGEDAMQASDYPEALKEFQKAMRLAPTDQTSQVAYLYRRLGDASRGRGNYDGAVMNYEIALELSPRDPEPLIALTELFGMQREFDAVEGYHRRYLEVQDEPEARARVWGAIATMWLEPAEDATRFEQILHEWIADLPGDIQPRQRLIRQYRQTGRIREAIDARLELARLLTDPEERAAELTETAREVRDDLGDADYAVQVALEAVAADAHAIDAVECAEVLLARAERWQDLAAFYERLLQEVDERELALRIGPKLGALYRDHLEAPERTISAYERVLEEAPERVDLRRELIDLYIERGADRMALTHCRSALKTTPGERDLYRKAYMLLDRVGATDSAWNAAVVLECLGEADINEQLVADAHRPNGLLPAKGSLLDDDWGAGVFLPERDELTSELLASVLDVATEVRATYLKKKKQAPKLAPDMRHDPATSTTTLAKSLLWTSKLLSVKPPLLYVADSVEGDLSAAPVDEPSALVSKSLASGLSLSELAFLWGRHLSLFRPEHYLAVFFRTAEEMATLVRASLAAAEVGKVTMKSLNSEGKRLAKELKKKLHPGSRERLRAAAANYPVDEIEPRVARWLRSVELAGGRAGLLACGDVAIAAALVKRHPVRGSTTQEDQVSDIMCYAVSGEYAEMRGRLGVAIAS